MLKVHQFDFSQFLKTWKISKDPGEFPRTERVLTVHWPAEYKIGYQLIRSKMKRDVERLSKFDRTRSHPAQISFSRSALPRASLSHCSHCRLASFTSANVSLSDRERSAGRKYKSTRATKVTRAKALLTPPPC